MIQPFRLAIKIQQSKDFKQMLLANYIEHSNGVTMQQYAKSEKKLLSIGTYGVEDYYLKVIEYIKFLDSIID